MWVKMSPELLEEKAGEAEAFSVRLRAGTV
jgi:hypothetical protein